MTTEKDEVLAGWFHRFDALLNDNPENLEE